MAEDYIFMEIRRYSPVSMTIWIIVLSSVPGKARGYNQTTV